MRQKIKINEQQLNTIVAESIRKILKEEKTIDNDIVSLISYLHNIQKPLREIHWNTNEYSLHMVTDETLEKVLEWEDSLGETFISNSNYNLIINDDTIDTPKNPKKDYEKLMLTLSDTASNLKAQINDNKKYDNINSILDDILEKTHQLLYKSRLA